MAVMKITNENFETEVLQSDKPVLIDFFATWCGPCKMLSPIVDGIAEEHPEIKVCKIDIDEEPSLAEKFGVMSIPTLVVMKNGKPVRTSVGFKSRDAVLSLLAESFLLHNFRHLLDKSIRLDIMKIVLSKKHRLIQGRAVQSQISLNL